jgi:hypothetical protein
MHNTLHLGHSFWNIQDTVEVIQIARKGRHMNSEEKYHIFCVCKEKKQMNEVLINLKILYLIPYTNITSTSDIQITLHTTPQIAEPYTFLSRHIFHNKVRKNSQIATEVHT